MWVVSCLPGRNQIQSSAELHLRVIPYLRDLLRVESIKQFQMEENLNSLLEGEVDKDFSFATLVIKMELEERVSCGEQICYFSGVVVFYEM